MAARPHIALHDRQRAFARDFELKLDEIEAGKWSVDLPAIENLREDRNLWR